MFQRSRQGAINVVKGDLALSGDSLTLLTGVFEQCYGEGQPRAVFDMQEVPLIDSAGLETLLDIRDEFEQRAGTLKLAAPNTLCTDILSVTGVGSYFEIFPQVSTAVGSFVQ